MSKFLSDVYEVDHEKEVSVAKLELYIKFPIFGIEWKKLKIDPKKLLDKYFPYIKPNFFCEQFKDLYIFEVANPILVLPQNLRNAEPHSAN